MVSANTLFHCI